MTDQTNSVNNPPKSVKDQVALLTFIDNLIKEKNDLSIKPDQLPNVKAALLKEINEMINTRMVSLLSDESQKELDQLLDKNISDEEMDQFFMKKIPNLSAEIASVLVDFRVAYLTPLTEIKTKEKNSSDDLLTPSAAPIGNNNQIND